MSGFSFVYRAKYFMEEDVVLVTINYRVNSFGSAAFKFMRERGATLKLILDLQDFSIQRMESCVGIWVSRTK